MEGLGWWNQFLKIPNYLKPCSTRFSGSQRASLHPELPQWVLKVNSCSLIGFNRWQKPLLLFITISALCCHCYCSSIIAKSCLTLLQPHGLQHARPLGKCQFVVDILNIRPIMCVRCSAMSDSLWPHGLWPIRLFSLHGIFQARILERVAISFSRGFSWSRVQIRVSHIAGRFFTFWATREAQNQ